MNRGSHTECLMPLFFYMMSRAQIRAFTQTQIPREISLKNMDKNGILKYGVICIFMPIYRMVKLHKFDMKSCYSIENE